MTRTTQLKTSHDLTLLVTTEVTTFAEIDLQKLDIFLSELPVLQMRKKIGKVVTCCCLPSVSLAKNFHMAKLPVLLMTSNRKGR